MNADTRPTQQTDATDGNLSHIVHMRRASDTSTNPNWPYSWRKTRNRLAVSTLNVFVISHINTLANSGGLKKLKFTLLIFKEFLLIHLWYCDTSGLNKTAN